MMFQPAVDEVMMLLAANDWFPYQHSRHFTQYLLEKRESNSSHPPSLTSSSHFHSSPSSSTSTTIFAADTASFSRSETSEDLHTMKPNKSKTKGKKVRKDESKRESAHVKSRSLGSPTSPSLSSLGLMLIQLLSRPSPLTLTSNSHPYHFITSWLPYSHH